VTDQSRFKACWTDWGSFVHFRGKKDHGELGVSKALQKNGRAITCNKNKVSERKSVSLLVNTCKAFKIKTAGQSLNGQ
jgi:hypothetical protein